MFHQEAQHFTWLRFGNANVVVFVDLDLIGQVVQHIGQRVRFVVAHFVEQGINRRAGLHVVLLRAHGGHADKLLEWHPRLQNGLRLGHFLHCVSHHLLRFQRPRSYSAWVSNARM